MKRITYEIIRWIGIGLTAIFAIISAACAYLLICNATGMEAPALGPWRMYVVLSDSMVPTMRTGDAIITRETAAEKLEVGDVITFRAFESETIVTHRITAKEKTAAGHEFRTKGDNNNAEDGFVTAESRIIGRQAAVVRGLGRLVEAVGERPYMVAVPVLMAMAFQFLLGVLERKLRPAKESTEVDSK